MAQNMDLETWRKREGLSYQRLADLLGEGDQNTARRHALGIFWPAPERIEKIRKVSGGEVTLEAMHRRHLAWRNGQVESAA